jgi:hypothetical protein
VQNFQTSLPPEIPEGAPRICAWCGAPSVGFITLEPARYSMTKPARYDENGKRLRDLKKRAIVAQVCGHHYKTLKLNDGKQ